MSTLVSVGNCYQPFRRLLDEVARLAGLRAWPQPVFVQHGHTPFSSPYCTAVPFLGREEFERRLAESELVILHTGAGSVMQAIRAGRVPVVMPRRASDGEHVDDHQAELARRLAASGLLVVATEAHQLLDATRLALRLQTERKAAPQERRERLLPQFVRQALEDWSRNLRRQERAS